MSLVLYKIFFKSSHASFLPWLLYIGIIGFALVLLIPPARKNIVEIYKNTQFTFLVTDKIISCSGGGTALPIPAYCIAIDSIDRIIKKTEYKEKDGQKNIRVHYRIVNIRGQRYDIPSSFDNPRKKSFNALQNTGRISLSTNKLIRRLRSGTLRPVKIHGKPKSCRNRKLRFIHRTSPHPLTQLKTTKQKFCWNTNKAFVQAV